MNSKKELWILLSSFVLPIVLGTAFFYWNPTAFTGTTVNYSHLLKPQKMILFFQKKHQVLQIAFGPWLTSPTNATALARKHSKT